MDIIKKKLYILNFKIFLVTKFKKKKNNKRQMRDKIKNGEC